MKIVTMSMMMVRMMMMSIRQMCVGMRVGVKIAAVAVQVKGACSRSWRMQAASIGINITVFCSSVSRLSFPEAHWGDKPNTIVCTAAEF